jgi:hypothetical protein
VGARHAAQAIDPRTIPGVTTASALLRESHHPRCTCTVCMNAR